jgi:hypothetical protein
MRVHAASAVARDCMRRRERRRERKKVCGEGGGTGGQGGIERVCGEEKERGTETEACIGAGPRCIRGM